MTQMTHDSCFVSSQQLETAAAIASNHAPISVRRRDWLFAPRSQSIRAIFEWED
jgi:hypothetical protein